MACLHPEDAGEGPEQVVPGVENPAAGDRGALHPDDRADDRPAHQQPRELGHVTDPRDGAGGVETVRARVVGVGQAELPCAGVHHCHESSLASLTDVVGKRVRGIVRALDQRALEQLPDGQPLAGPKLDRGLADRGGPRGDGDDVARLRVLDRQEHRHQLRQARDRNTGLLAVLGEHLARRAVLHHVRPGVHLREGGESGGRERESRGDSNQRALHGRKD